MKIRKFFAAVLALCLMACMIPASAETVLTIGVIGPMTGGAAVYGTAVAHGAQIAADEINAKNGDIRIKLDVQDDEHDPEKAINAYYTVLDNGVQMILGTVTTGPCLAVSEIAYEMRVFMLTPSASATGVTEGKDNVFQVCFTDPGQGVAAADKIFEMNAAAKVGIIYNNSDAYSTGIKDAFVEQAAKVGLEIVATSSFSSDANTDFSVQIAACKDAGADLVFLPIYYTPASLILNQSNAIAYAPTFFGVDGMDGILTLEGFDKTLAEDVMLLTPFAASSQDAATQAFVQAYVAAYGEEPNQFAADAYDGIMALYEACQKVGITSDTSYEEACELLLAEFPNLEIAGLTGKLSWDASGAVTKDPTVYVIKDGAYAMVE
ncbi:MAG: amino acid ABC transporter substrate-binding protein [Clostridiales bacterium]|nr:amino acid ABC transporter substrate-binding protein [Clostridiales bacterium]